MSAGIVMVVDDEPINIEILAVILEQDPYEVVFATSGERALELVPTARPDLILLDVMLPGIDGYTVCERLKRDPATAGNPGDLHLRPRSPRGRGARPRGRRVGFLDEAVQPGGDPRVRARPHRSAPRRPLGAAWDQLSATPPIDLSLRTSVAQPLAIAAVVSGLSV